MKAIGHGADHCAARTRVSNACRNGGGRFFACVAKHRFVQCVRELEVFVIAPGVRSRVWPGHGS